MPALVFRRFAHQVADWMADYQEGVGDLPVLSRVAPGDVRRALGSVAPELGDDFDQVLEDFRTLILPGITHWNHPGFFAYFAISGSGPGVLGEMMSAALNVNAMNWRSSPAATELEEVACAWTRDLLGLPPHFDGVINDTASHSSFYALAAAREHAYPGVRTEGLFGRAPGRVYASAHAHSSIDKSVTALGLGLDGVCHVDADEAFRMDPAALDRAIRRDLDRGVRPVAVVAAVGTTSTTSVDPVDQVARVATEHGVWLHVDAAYAGPAASVPELRPLFAGWEGADSIVVNPHKWMFTPVDCSILYCRRPALLREAFSLTPAYLTTDDAGETRNLMDYGLALGRRFRALKLWFVLRYFGQEGIRARIRAHCGLARTFAGWVREAPDWTLVAPVPFSTVVFRYEPTGGGGTEVDGLNREVMDRVNRAGEVFLSHTELDGRVALRLAVGNLRTKPEHVARAWASLQAAATALSSVPPRAAAGSAE